MPLSTALKGTKSALVRRAIRRASVVLPTPGGPQRMMEPISSRSICARSGLPGPTMCSCPAKSSQRSGRMRSARGLDLSVSLGTGLASNRPIIHITADPDVLWRRAS